MNTFGFHGIHGRAAAIATGVKLANPKLQVWVATGDGDMLSIGGNHFIHMCRKNINIKILMFNNRIYGLTKGQYSPTSVKGQVTKSSPYGTVDFPFNAIKLATGSGATFLARSLDRDPKHLQEMITRASKNIGAAFIEVYQNCPIFNDGAFSILTEKETKPENVIVLEHGKPLVFGKQKEKGIRLNGFTPEVAAAYELASCAQARGLSDEYILPTMDEWDVVPRVAVATAMKAQEQGVARLLKAPEELYRSAEQKIREARRALAVLTGEGVIARPPKPVH